jgi:hypothetical protein
MILPLLRRGSGGSSSSSSSSSSKDDGGFSSLLTISATLMVCATTTVAQWQPVNLPVTMPTAPYELEPYDPIAAAASVVVAGNARFTILSSRMIRMEYNPSKQFEDRATIGFLNRKTAKVEFRTKRPLSGAVTIDTADVTLTYSGKGPFTESNLKVNGKHGAFKQWAPGMANDGNLLGTIKSLDQIGPTSLNCTENAHIIIHEETLHCTWGLISRTGWSIYDDSNSPVLDSTGWWGHASTDRKSTTFVNNSDAQDWYGFFHGTQHAVFMSSMYVVVTEGARCTHTGHDYKAALTDYVQVGGKIAMVPRQALGLWWTRWFVASITFLKGPLKHNIMCTIQV